MTTPPLVADAERLVAAVIAVRREVNAGRNDLARNEAARAMAAAGALAVRADHAGKRDLARWAARVGAHAANVLHSAIGDPSPQMASTGTALVLVANELSPAAF